jgi:hypothetical protein
MTKFSILGAVAVVAAALASPALAQEVIYNPGYCAQFYPNANCQNKGPGNPYTDGYQRYGAYQYDNWNNGWHDSWSNNSFSGPGNAYAYDGSTYGYEPGFARSDYYANAHAGHGWNRLYDNRYNNSYAAVNGFVCKPGTYFRGDDGLRHRCQ